MILRFCSTGFFYRNYAPCDAGFAVRGLINIINTLYFQMVYQLRNKMMVVSLNTYTGY